MKRVAIGMKRARVAAPVKAYLLAWSAAAKAQCQPLQEISKQLIAALSIVALAGLSKQRT